MDINAIKAKLEALNKNSNDQERVDFSKVYWKPSFGKNTIRIVPAFYSPEFPFTEMKFHYHIAKFPMASLSNWGKQDPIEEFVSELKKTDSKENWKLAGKLTPKTRIFAPVIVRGEEEKGVRLWDFGVTVYKALLALAEDEDVGDYTDVMNGWDLVVDYEKGNPYPTTSVRIKPKQLPLSKNSEEVDKWLKEQPNPKEVSTQFNYAYIKQQLQNYLVPSSESEESPEEEAEKSVPSKFSLESNQSSSEKTNLVSKFDDLFKEEGTE